MVESQSDSSMLLLTPLNLKRGQGSYEPRAGHTNGFAEGERTMPGPGKKVIVFRHCHNRRDEAISERAV
jgi:hypothetical protein